MLLEEAGMGVGGNQKNGFTLQLWYGKLSHFHIFGWREAFGEWILGEMWLENFNQGGKMSAGGHLHFRNVFDSSSAKRSELLVFQISVDSRGNYILLRIKCSAIVFFLHILSPSDAHSR